MANTTNYNLTKPDSGASGWAGDVNANFDAIDGQMKSNADAVAGHTGAGTGKHTASQVSTSGSSDVQTQLDLKAAQTDMDAVEAFVDLLSPNLTSVTVSATITNINGGVRIKGDTTPDIYITQWVIVVSEGGSQVCSVTSSSNVVFIPASDLTGVISGDTLSITVTAHAGESSKGVGFSHTYTYINSKQDDDLASLTASLGALATKDEIKSSEVHEEYKLPTTAEWASVLADIEALKNP